MKCLLISLFTVMASSAFAEAPKSTPELIAKGKELYTTNCFTCHGDKGDGQGPAGKYMVPKKPRNFTKDKFVNGSDPAGIFKTVTNGLPNTAMVSFKTTPGLTTDEARWAVAYYINATFVPKK